MIEIRRGEEPMTEEEIEALLEEDRHAMPLDLDAGELIPDALGHRWSLFSFSSTDAFEWWTCARCGAGHWGQLYTLNYWGRSPCAGVWEPDEEEDGDLGQADSEVEHAGRDPPGRQV
jgi:hypothetical protein